MKGVSWAASIGDPLFPAQVQRLQKWAARNFFFFLVLSLWCLYIERVHNLTLYEDKDERISMCTPL